MRNTILFVFITLLFFGSCSSSKRTSTSKAEPDKKPKDNYHQNATDQILEHTESNKGKRARKTEKARKKRNKQIAKEEQKKAEKEKSKKRILPPTM